MTNPQALRGAEMAASRQGNAPVSSLVLPCTKALEVLVLGEDQKPVSGVAIQLREGERASQTRTSANGLVRFEGLRGGGYQICPYELDEDAWKMLNVVAMEDPASRSEASWQDPAAEPTEAEGVLHRVRQGDCIDGLAFQGGLFPEAVWNHGRNAGLKAKRESENVLYEGDEVFLPPIRRREVAAEVSTRTILQRKGVPSQIRIRLLNDLRPVANTAWLLEIPGEATVNGQTDGDGVLEAWIPATAQTVKVRYKVDGAAQDVEFELGSLAPVHEAPGWRHRMWNLGFRCDPDGGEELTEEDRGALRRLQESFGLEVTGEADEATVAKLYAIQDGAPAELPEAGMYAAEAGGV